MHDEAAPLSTRLTAARTVLENMLRLRELRTIEERLAKLEAINADDHHPTEEA